MITIPKDPVEEIFEGFDYSDRMRSGDFLVSSEWTVGSGLTAGEATFDDKTSEIELKGGTATNTYLVSNTVTTSLGSVYKRSFKVLVRTR